MNRIFILSFFAIMYGEVTNDSLAVLIEEGKEEILNEVKYDDPLEGKKGGVEINPLYWLLYSEDGLSFAGSLSIFPANKNIEIAIPLAFKSDTEFWGQATFRMDVQYRYFLGKHRKGIYIMTGVRHGTFDGYAGDSWDEVPEENYTKQGISFGVGYRLFAKSGIYWGTSFYIGKYISGPTTEWGNDRFMNIEFFKFGKTF